MKTADMTFKIKIGMRIFFFGILLITAIESNAQSLTGSWYGKADVINSNDNNYLTELIIKQKGDEVEGIFGYYFRDGYKSVFIRGNYNAKTRKFLLNKIPITYFRSSNIDGVDCYMDFYGTVMISKVKTSLSGTFSTDSKYKYTCPEIAVNFVLDDAEKNQDSLIKYAVARKLWQPRSEDVVITGQAETKNTSTITTTNAAKNNVIPETSPMEKLIEVFNRRQSVLAKEIEVESDSIRISFYDNGDIDQDSISVFLNKKPIIVKQELTAAALNLYLKLDSSRDVNEISMYAENLGLYPPNTALMIVNDGKHRYEIYLSSSFTQNAVVRLRRKK
jgi:hypothetical protein